MYWIHQYLSIALKKLCHMHQKERDGGSFTQCFKALLGSERKIGARKNFIAL